MPAFYGPMAAHLAGDHTVVTYDPRGNSRSPLDGVWEDQRVEVHSDDADRLLELLAGGRVRQQFRGHCRA
jgi:pimeloyl-ACP methyl ester carboxylesterase